MLNRYIYEGVKLIFLYSVGNIKFSLFICNYYSLLYMLCDCIK